MTNLEIYRERKVESNNIWLLFFLFGWSYGSMGKMGKQLAYYLTLGGLGMWAVYRLFSLNTAIKERNRKIAIECGLTTDELLKLNLV